MARISARGGPVDGRAVVPVSAGLGLVVLQTAVKAFGERTRFTLTPSRRFDPSPEQIWRQAALLLRASNAGPWWAPMKARSVRLRLRADGSSPLEWSMEGAASTAQLLAGTPFAEATVAQAPPVRDKSRRHTVRAEFTVRGNPAAVLREVPLDPDPLRLLHRLPHERHRLGSYRCRA